MTFPLVSVDALMVGSPVPLFQNLLFPRQEQEEPSVAAPGDGGANNPPPSLPVEDECPPGEDCPPPAECEAARKRYEALLQRR